MKMAQRKAYVTFDYQAEEGDELSLKVGDVLSNVKEVEEGWCQGVLNGKTGMFPSNFVKLEIEKSHTPNSSSKPKDEARNFMKVTHPYEPSNDDELKLEAGDIIEVLQTQEEGWAKGRLKGHEGVFPTNFCVVADGKSNHDLNGKAKANSDVTNHAENKKVKGVGFGDIFSKGAAKTAKSEADKASSSVTNQKAKGQATSKEGDQAANRKAKAVEKCRVSFDYEAQTSDELTLTKGDIVRLISKDSGDDGWWEGELVDRSGRKRRGVFPDNFVVLLPPSEESTEKKTSTPPQVKKTSSDTKSKPNSTVPDKSEAKVKSAARVPSLLSSIGKRPAPQLPPTAMKSPSALEKGKNSGEKVNGVFESSPNEKQLTHYKRPVGPAGRKKPNAANRRERAKDSGKEENLEPEDDEVASPAAHAVAAQTVVVRRTPPQNRRPMSAAIPVMPSLGSDANGGDVPDWLKKLKNRQSLKREPSPLSVAATAVEDGAKPAPDWLTNRQKTSKPVDEEVSTKSTFTTKPASWSSVKEPQKGITDASSIEEGKFSKSSKFPSRSKSESNILASAPKPSEIAVEAKPVEVKKVPTKPHTALQPPSMPISKKPSASTKPKPPPLKSKPALPPSKPSLTNASVDELKEELKTLKKQFAQLQHEHELELGRLNKDLDEERSKRLKLQCDVADLRQRLG